MRKIIIMLAMMLCCVVARGQEIEYEVVKDEDSIKICFIKCNLFKNNENGYWTTKKGDLLIKQLIDNGEEPIVIRNVSSNCYNDYSNIEENGSETFKEYYVYGYYTIENNCYFLYKIRNHYIITLELDNRYEIKFTSNPLTEGYRSTEFSIFDDGKTRKAILNGYENYLQGNLIFDF